MDYNATNICNLFLHNKPFLIGRVGTIELETLLFYTHNRIKGDSYPSSMLKKLELHAGIFPINNKSVDSWAEAHLNAIKNSNALAEGWYDPLKMYEQRLFNKYNPTRISIFLRNLESYYVKPELRWTQYLQHKKVAIINSFAPLCIEQTKHSSQIWGHDFESILPSSTTWIPIRTFYPPILADGSAQWNDSIKSWEDALNYIIINTLSEKPDFAIIGCGGLGMLIADKLKSHNISSIVLGGATQIMFGIKGKRWLTHNVISTFMNDSWIHPTNDYVPKNADKIEGGCYW